ncbi:MAG: rhodanese-like domain-containing protein [Anaerolineales bacterium]
MGKKQTIKKKIRVWGMGALVLVLALGLWIWPTYLAPSTGFVDSALAISVQDQHITVQEAQQKRENEAFMLDVRTVKEWNAGHIPGATLIPLDQLSVRYGELPIDQEIVIYCRSGNRSAQALSMLTEAGFSTIYSMNGGINNWISAGFEVVTGE